MKKFETTESIDDYKNNDQTSLKKDCKKYTQNPDGTPILIDLKKAKIEDKNVKIFFKET